MFDGSDWYTVARAVDHIHVGLIQQMIHNQEVAGSTAHRLGALSQDCSSLRVESLATAASKPIVDQWRPKGERVVAFGSVLIRRRTYSVSSSEFWV